MKSEKQSAAGTRFSFSSSTAAAVQVFLQDGVSVCVHDLGAASCQAGVWFKLLLDDRRRRGNVQRRSWAQLPGIKQWPLHNERWRQHFPLTRFHTVTRFAYSYIFPPPPLPFFQCKLFFLWAGHLPPWHCSGRRKIKKYVCREAHDLSRCHRNMAWCWHRPTPTNVCVFHSLSTRK